MTVTESTVHEKTILESIDDLIAGLENDHGLNTTQLRKTLQGVTEDEANEQAMFYALNSVNMADPNWTYAAERFYLNQLYSEAAENRGYSRSLKYGDLYKLINHLIADGVYSPRLLEKYSVDEIKELQSAIDPKKDLLFSYIGLFMLADRYLANSKAGKVFELPQERFMIIAMVLMQNEVPEKRMELVKEAYWAMSNLFMTVATPTLTNAGKTFGQLSSCFIDMVEDSLNGIKLNDFDISRLSKNGGGIGIYMGGVRAQGSAIQGFAGNSGGIVPWIRSINQTAVSVDQLGTRKGAIAVYYDVDGKDILPFLDLKTNNGDDRMKAHDIFTGVTIPDLFMKKLDEVDEHGKSIGEWHTFCPYEVRTFMNWKDEHGNPLGLEDFYDETDRKYYTEKYNEAVNHPLLPRTTYRAMDIMTRIMKAQLETGTPYMFYRDEVNRQNPNKHILGEGRTAIFCSNLCTEITQNMSPTTVVDEYVDENGLIHLVRKPGDFVVCNLSSINLPKVYKATKNLDGDSTAILKRLLRIQVRMLDNVIDINTIPVPQATLTNEKYRAIGLGTFGWHHLLALQEIHWESAEAEALAHSLYEVISFGTIEASMLLAEEKGSYSQFEGSEWATGKYFDRKNLVNSDSGLRCDWDRLRSDVASKGLRNGYLMAVAPNSSTAKIGDSTDGIDPVYEVEYGEEKKNFKFLVTVPDLDHVTYDYYRKARHELDQTASIRQNARRQRFIDQSQSFNLYVPHTIRAKELLQLHKTAWKEKLKTTYYVKSTSQEEMDSGCEACES